MSAKEWDDTDWQKGDEFTAEQFNDHVEEGHFPSDQLNFDVDAEGNPIATDPQNGDQVVATYNRGEGTWEFESVSAEQLQSGPLKVGVLGDTHWRGSSRQPPDVPSTSTTKADLDAFIDDMNDWGADVVVQMGDLGDGMNVTFSELQTSISNAIDYLENSGGSDGNGLDARVEHILGNHEYAFAGSQSMSDIYSLYGWSDLSDTYRVITVKGVNLILLNTGYGTVDRTTDKNDHEIPQQELDWMRNTLPDLDGESYMFHHVPLSEGKKNDGYDNVVNDKEASSILRDSPAYTAGFFGHSHHAGAQGWDRVREQKDDDGNRYLHLPDPHDLDGDTSIKPHLKLSIYPGTGYWEAETNYSEQDSPFDTTWRGAGEDSRRVDPGIEMFRNRTTPYRFTFPEDKLQDNVSVSGSASVPATGNGSMRVRTGATSGSTAQYTQQRQLKLEPTTWEWQTQTIAFQTRVEFGSGSMSNQTLKLFFGGIGDTNHHIGFRVDGNNLKASVADGATENATASLKTLSSGQIVTLAALYNPYEGAAYFYIDDLQRARLTSNLPESGINYFNKWANLYAENSEAAGKAFSLSSWEVFAAGETVTFDLLR